MKLSRAVRNILVVDFLLGIFLAVLLMTPLLDFRDYGTLPEPDREWREIVAEMEGLSGMPFRDRIENSRAFRTLRSTPVKRATGAINDYEVAGHGNGRVYFMNKKTNALTGYSVGEVIEDYVIVNIGEESVELEKDGSRIEFPL